MSELLATLSIYSPLHDSHQKVGLYRHVDDTQIKLVEIAWNPVFHERVAVADLIFRQTNNPPKELWPSLVGKYGIPDHHWNWRTLILSTRGGTTQDSFCLLALDQIQAIMTVDLSKRARIPEQLNQHLVYVDYLAVAPWNRTAIQKPVLFKGLGKIMLGVAVSLSIDEEWDGRIGLHSLPQAEGFYGVCGMSDLGIDREYENLHYFEFTGAQARAFLGSV